MLPVIYVSLLKSFESSMDIDAWILDYKNERIVYATKNSNILINNNIRILDFSYFENILPQKELQTLIKISQAGFNFFYSLPINRRLNGYITYDLRIKRPCRFLLMNIKFSPIILTGKGIIRLALCIMSNSVNCKSGNVYIKMNDTLKVYELIEKSDKFVEIKKQKISSKSFSVLQLASKGMKEAEIAETLNISLSTVKYHKKQIFDKLNVKNTVEAVQWINNQKKGSIK